MKFNMTQITIIVAIGKRRHIARFSSMRVACEFIKSNYLVIRSAQYGVTAFEEFLDFCLS